MMISCLSLTIFTMPSKYFSLLFYSIIFLFFGVQVFSQREVGLGVHFSPPANITYTSNAFVKIKPLITPAFSLSYRKSWKNKRQKEWYWEASASTFGLNYNVQNYFNDTATVWGWAKGNVVAERIVKDREGAMYVRNPESVAKLWRIKASKLRPFTAREYARLQTFPDIGFSTVIIKESYSYKSGMLYL